MSPDVNNYDEFRTACRNIMQAARSAAPGSLLHYAASYASAGLSLTDQKAISVQALYILNNITHWRGDVAKQTRATLKAYVL